MISIVISVYNEEQTIGKTIESVLAQTYADFELIIIDDGSQDQTHGVAHRYQQQDQRIKLYQNTENIGLTRSLNIGIEHAAGEWIGRIDADDTWHPEKLAIQMRYLEQHPKVGLIGTWTIARNKQTGQEKLIKKPITDQEIKKVVWKFPPLSHPTILIKKELLQQRGMYNPRYSCAQDYDLYFRLVFDTTCYNIPRPLCTIHTHREQGISLNNWKQSECNRLLIQWRNMRQHGVSVSKYFVLLPLLLKLGLPVKSKRWKQSLTNVMKSGKAG